jgi:hypothetical protein
MSHARIRTAVIVLLLAVVASCSADDDGASTASKAEAEVPTTPAEAPVEFTACVNPGPNVHNGTEEFVEVPLSDGLLTVKRSRRDTWQSTVRDVSDPRLVGTWYNSINGDQYTMPGSGPGPILDAWTHRIENEEGAWQGSLLGIEIPGGESLDGPLVMVGEGAYEGLTAVAIVAFGGGPCPNTRGYIIDGTVPPPPVPSTGR